MEHAKYYKILGNNLAYYRKKKHLTQEGLAMKANVSRVHISHIEAEGVQKTPSLDILFRIATILNIEPYQLFQERTDENPSNK